jgi:hypothetical protein
MVKLTFYESAAVATNDFATKVCEQRIFLSRSRFRDAEEVLAILPRMRQQGQLQRPPLPQGGCCQTSRH